MDVAKLANAEVQAVVPSCPSNFSLKPLFAYVIEKHQGWIELYEGEVSLDLVRANKLS